MNVIANCNDKYSAVRSRENHDTSQILQLTPLVFCHAAGYAFFLKPPCEVFYSCDSNRLEDDVVGCADHARIKLKFHRDSLFRFVLSDFKKDCCSAHYIDRFKLKMQSMVNEVSSNFSSAHFEEVGVYVCQP